MACETRMFARHSWLLRLAVSWEDPADHCPCPYDDRSRVACHLVGSLPQRQLAPVLRLAPTVTQYAVRRRCLKRAVSSSGGRSASAVRKADRHSDQPPMPAARPCQSWACISCWASRAARWEGPRWTGLARHRAARPPAAAVPARRRAGAALRSCRTRVSRCTCPSQPAQRRSRLVKVRIPTGQTGTARHQA